MKRINLRLAALFVFLFLLIPPSIIIGNFNIPVMYILMPVFTIIFILILLGKIKVPNISKKLILIWFLIIFEVIFSGIFGPIYLLGNFNFPTEVIQYIARFLIFIVLISVFYNSKTNEHVFLKYFLIISIIAMSIAILQWIPWPGQEFFLRIYQQVNRDLFERASLGLDITRVPGIARHATATGGLAAFIFSISLVVILLKHKYRNIAMVAIILSVINLIMAQARGGMLAVFITGIFIYYIVGKDKRKVTKNLIKLSVLLLILYSILLYLYNRGTEFVVRIYDRWLRLFEQVEEGGNRVAQIESALDLLNDPYTIFFGVSRGFQTYIDFFMEVEFINVLVLYGVIGFVLQYGLVVFLFYYYYRNLSMVKNNQTVHTLTLASLVGLFSYQVFSIAYYFFREINVGLFPWVLFGITIGIIERYKLREKVKNEKN